MLHCLGGQTRCRDASSENLFMVQHTSQRHNSAYTFIIPPSNPVHDAFLFYLFTSTFRIEIIKWIMRRFPQIFLFSSSSPFFIAHSVPGKKRDRQLSSEWYTDWYCTAQHIMHFPFFTSLHSPQKTSLDSSKRLQKSSHRQSENFDYVIRILRHATRRKNDAFPNIPRHFKGWLRWVDKSFDTFSVAHTSSSPGRIHYVTTSFSLRLSVVLFVYHWRDSRWWHNIRGWKVIFALTHRKKTDNDGGKFSHFSLPHKVEWMEKLWFCLNCFQSRHWMSRRRFLCLNRSDVRCSLRM